MIIKTSYQKLTSKILHTGKVTKLHFEYIFALTINYIYGKEESKQAAS